MLPGECRTQTHVYVNTASVKQLVRKFVKHPLNSSQRHLLWVGTIKKPRLKVLFKTLPVIQIPCYIKLKVAICQYCLKPKSSQEILRQRPKPQHFLNLEIQSVERGICPIATLHSLVAAYKGGRCKQGTIIFHESRVVVNFVPKFVAMATGVSRKEI